MAKKVRQVSGFVPPGIVTLVSCGRMNARSNITTVSLTSLANTDTMCVFMVPNHYSCAVIRDSKEFVVNYPTVELLEAVDFCGNNSGADTDKFMATGLTKVAATHVSAPLIGECPVSLECRLVNSLNLGMMRLLVGSILAYHVDEGCMDDQGRIDFSGKGFLAYGGMYGAGAYMPLGDLLGYSGLSKVE